MRIKRAPLVAIVAIGAVLATGGYGYAYSYSHHRAFRPTGAMPTATRSIAPAATATKPSVRDRRRSSAPTASPTTASPSPTVSTGSGPNPAARDALVYGVSTGDISTAALRTQLPDASRLGAQMVRIDIQWDQVQPSPGASYNLADVEARINDAATHGQKVQAIFDVPPSWAAIPGCRDAAWDCAVNPKYAEDYAAFVSAVTNRFSDHIVTAELLNEPNALAGYYDHPELYAQLVHAVAVHPGRNPRVELSAGGTADVGTTSLDSGVNSTTWYQQLAQHGLAQDVQRIAAHCYTFPSSVVDAENNRGWRECPQIHQLFPRLPLDITEIGWSTGGGNGSPDANAHPEYDYPKAVTETVQAGLYQELFATFNTLHQQGVLARIFVYSLRDTGGDPSDIESHFGLLTAGGMSKPAYTAIQTAIRQYSAAS